MGDFNEDQFNVNNRLLRNILIENTLKNTLSVFTPDRALLGPLILPEDAIVYDSDILANPANVCDLSATF